MIDDFYGENYFYSRKMMEKSFPIRMVIKIFNKIRKHKYKVIFIAVSVCIAYLSFFWLPADNQIEQSVEMLIKNQTGLDIDLTP